jgi:signal transduction histidine kinase
LITTVQESIGAQAATYLECRGDVGRIVIATGPMVPTLGQPVGLEHLNAASLLPDDGLRRVSDLPPLLAASPTRYGFVALAGAKVYRGSHRLGAVDFYFDSFDLDVPEVMSIVDMCAAIAARLAVPVVTPPASGAEAEDRALFLAVAGHELRTPVTVIKGYASMLADRWDLLDESNRREAARVLTLRADDLARLVDRLLRASTGESDAGWLVRTVPFDPTEALARTAHELPVDLRRVLTLQVPADLPPAMGDPALLTSIVAELVTNAVRASPAAASRDTAPCITLTAGADSDTVFIQVRDRGMGIDPAASEAAFDRFWRGSHQGGDARAGVGLGLYLVRRLVERQNGWVSLRPRDGGGTVAEVRLLRADGPGRGPTLGRA